MALTEGPKGHPLEAIDVEQSRLIDTGADSAALLAVDEEGREWVLQVYITPFFFHSDQREVSRRLQQYSRDQNEFSAAIANQPWMRVVSSSGEHQAQIHLSVCSRGDLGLLPATRIPREVLMHYVDGQLKAVKPRLLARLASFKIPTAYTDQVANGSRVVDSGIDKMMGRQGEYATMNDGTLGSDRTIIVTLLDMAATELNNRLAAFNRLKRSNYALAARNICFYILEGVLYFSLTDIGAELFPEIRDKRNIALVGKRFRQLKLI